MNFINFNNQYKKSKEEDETKQRSNLSQILIYFLFIYYTKSFPINSIFIASETSLNESIKDRSS